MYYVRITLSATSDLMRKCVFSLVLASAVSGWSQSLQPAVSAGQTSQHFDGKWWSKTSADEHSGFINGADDCLTWTAHKQVSTAGQKNFTFTWKQLNDMIGKFYESHAKSRDLTVVDVWRKVLENPRPNHVPGSEHAETWSNPHWYLDGFWWLEGTPDEKQASSRGISGACEPKFPHLQRCTPSRLASTSRK